MYDCFGKMFFRFSHNIDDHKLVYHTTMGVVFQGMFEFYDRMLKFGVHIYYNKNEICRWRNDFRFERKSNNMEWFDLDLVVSEEDLKIIESVDAQNRLAQTKQGLILLTKKQSDILKFIKKYTIYEKEKTEKEIVDGKTVHRFTLPFKKARIFELFELQKLGVPGALTQEEVALCERLATMEEMPVYEIPESFSEILRPYQKTGYNWLRFLYENKLGACLADDMGLGKTLQTISFIKGIYHRIDKVLVVCPVTILLNWEQEFAKFSDIPVYTYHGEKRVYPHKHKVIITSYGVMKKEIDSTFKDLVFDVFVLDEVQHLKNISSIGALAARKIKAKFRIGLTGTPVENDLVEFYNILDLSLPGIWGDLSFIRSNSSKKSRLLARKTATPFILRRSKNKVLSELPPKIENNILLSFSDVEKNHYQRTLVQIKSRITSSDSRHRYGEILKGLLELRQKCLWQVKSVYAKTEYDEIESTKIHFLLETLDQIIGEGNQALVFSQFTTYLDIIQHHMKHRNWDLARIDGSQSIKKRQEQVQLFQEGKRQIFLISLKAGGVGLNLATASYVFVMDPWWNPSVEQQAIDRAHRIGQKNTLTVYRPIIKDSVEEKVVELQKVKKELFYDLLPDDDDQIFTGKLKNQDFEALFA